MKSLRRNPRLDPAKGEQWKARQTDAHFKFVFFIPIFCFYSLPYLSPCLCYRIFVLFLLTVFFLSADVLAVTLAIVAVVITSVMNGRVAAGAGGGGGRVGGADAEFAREQVEQAN